jgi:hypothetical protein
MDASGGIWSIALRDEAEEEVAYDILDRALRRRGTLLKNLRRRDGTDERRMVEDGPMNATTLALLDVTSSP